MPRMTRKDIPLRMIVPAAKQGVAEIDHFEVPKGYIDFGAISSGLSSPSPGKYVRLIVNGRLQMSDTHMERRTNSIAVHRAQGRVLIVGLGIGYVLHKVLLKPEVKAVTVVEKHQDVIDLVAPHFPQRKLTTVCADIFEWKPPKGEKWNAIYFDIWPDACEDNLEEVAKLHQRFKNRLDRTNGHWMGSWMADLLRARRRAERERDRWWR